MMDESLEEDEFDRPTVFKFQEAHQVIGEWSKKRTELSDVFILVALALAPHILEIGDFEQKSVTK